MADIKDTPLTGAFRVLDKIGSGYVTIPLRAAAALFLLFRRRWRAASAFILTWAASEILLTTLKAWFHRGRPPGSLVAVNGYSFPSGHAIAASAIGVALVLAFMGAGPRRRKWEWLAVGFTFVMAFSRVYLHAHWLSDVVAGVLLGFGIAVASAALVGEVAGLLRPDPAQPAGDAAAPPAASTSPPAGSPIAAPTRRQLCLRCQIRYVKAPTGIWIPYVSTRNSSTAATIGARSASPATATRPPM